MTDDQAMVLFQECAGDPKKFARAIIASIADTAGEKAPWPILERLHLEAIMFAYNEGYSKACDGREFANPFAESGSQAEAWRLGTRDGKNARSATPPAPSVDDGEKSE